MTEAQQFYEQAEKIALEGLNSQQSKDATSYVHTLVDDWVKQADEESSLEANDLVDIGLSDLDKSITGTSGDKRVAILQSLAYTPVVQEVTEQALTMAKQVADENVSRQSIASEAEQLQKRVQSLIQEVKSFKDEENKRLLMRDLADADLEVRYVLEEEEGAISIRLNRYINS